MTLRNLGFPLFAALWSLSSQSAVITYTATDVSGSSWRYDYTLTNNTQSGGISEFTIDFALGSYQNLNVAASPGAWSSFTAEPDPLIPADGFFDSANGTPLAFGATASLFSVTFDWLGTGTPGAQAFDIVDPNNYGTPIESGQTIVAPPPVGVPEPGTLSLMALGILGVVSRKLRARRN